MLKLKNHLHFMTLTIFCDKKKRKIILIVLICENLEQKYIDYQCVIVKIMAAFTKSC